MSQPLEPLLDPPPRKVQLRRGIKNLRRAYRTVFAMVILVFGGWAAIDAFRWYDLTYHVQTTEAMILKKETIVRPTGHEYRVEYAFRTADGTEITHEAALALTVFEHTEVGRPAPIGYLPATARVDHWLFDNTAPRMHMMYLTIGHGFAALLAIIVWRLVERPLQRELRLARYGVVTPGVVTTISKPRGRRGIVKITYTFQTATGETRKGACNLPRRFPAHSLEPGSTIDIVLDPNKPRIHRPRLALDHVEFGDAGKKKS